MCVLFGCSAHKTTWLKDAHSKRFAAHRCGVVPKMRTLFVKASSLSGAYQHSILKWHCIKHGSVGELLVRVLSPLMHLKVSTVVLGPS